MLALITSTYSNHLRSTYASILRVLAIPASSQELPFKTIRIVYFVLRPQWHTASRCVGPYRAQSSRHLRARCFVGGACESAMSAGVRGRMPAKARKTKHDLMSAKLNHVAHGRDSRIASIVCRPGSAHVREEDRCGGRVQSLLRPTRVLPRDALQQHFLSAHAKSCQFPPPAPLARASVDMFSAWCHG